MLSALSQASVGFIHITARCRVCRLSSILRRLSSRSFAVALWSAATFSARRRMVIDMELEKSSPAPVQPADAGGGELIGPASGSRTTLGREPCEPDLLEWRLAGASREPARRNVGSADCVLRGGAGWELCDRFLTAASADAGGEGLGTSPRGGRGDALGATGGPGAPLVGVCCRDTASAPSGSAPSGTSFEGIPLSDLEPGREEEREAAAGGREEGRETGNSDGEALS